MTLCSESSLVNYGVEAARAVTLKCRSWGCDICQPDRSRQLVALARSGKPNTFVTLTSNPATGGSPASRARRLAHAWPKLVKRIKAKYGYSHIPYFCVFEATKKGEPHLHILLRVKWIDQRWLSNQMRELTSAPIVDIRHVTNSNKVANYISKYVGKDPHRFATCKRYWRTRSWELTTYEKPEQEGFWGRGWDIRDVSLTWLREAWESWGWEVVTEGRMLVGRARAPPVRRFEDVSIA